MDVYGSCYVQYVHAYIEDSLAESGNLNLKKSRVMKFSDLTRTCI